MFATIALTRSPVHERDGARETCVERLVLEPVRSGSLVDVDKLHGRPIAKRNARGQAQRTQRRAAAHETYLGVSGDADVTGDVESAAQCGAHHRLARTRVLCQNGSNVQSIPKVASDPARNIQLHLLR